MKDKWILVIKKSYIDLKFEFQNAEHMARFLNFFTDVYVEEADKDKLDMRIYMIAEDYEKKEDKE